MPMHVRGYVPLGWMCVVFFAWSLICAPVFADTFEISGLIFHVDQYREIDERSVEISLFGDTRILSPEGAQDFVFDKYLQTKDGLDRFRAVELETFLAATIERKRAKWFEQAFRALIRADKGSHDGIQRIVGSWDPKIFPQSLVPALEAVVAEKNFAKAAPPVLFFLARLSDKTEARRVYETLGEEGKSFVQDYLAAQFLAAVGDNDLAAAAAVTANAETIFGSTDDVILELRLALQRSLELSKVNPDDPLALEEVLARAAAGDKEHKILSRSIAIVASRTIHRVAETSLAAGDPRYALKVLSRMPLEAITATTLTLLSTSLESLQLKIDPIALEPQVAAFLIAVAGQDPATQVSTMAYLEREFTWLCKNGAPYKASALFNLIVSIRHDPSPENDALRLTLAVTWTKFGQMNDAKRSIDEMARGPGPFGVFRLLLAGYYVHPNLLILIVLIPFLLGFSIYLYIRDLRRDRIDAEERQEQRISDEYAPEEAPHGFSMARIPRALNPRMGEYMALLEEFELGPMATERQIKAAYRQRIKEVHPDLNHNSAEDRARFVALTSLYERIVQLRKDLHL